MVKIRGEIKDFGDLRKTWGRLLEKIGSDGNDYLIFAIKPRKKIRYFHARVKDQCIVIEKAKKHIETSQITAKRKIYYDEFKCVAQLYNEYINGTKGIRPRMRDQCGRNASYVISLIHHLL